MSLDFLKTLERNRFLLGESDIPRSVRESIAFYFVDFWQGVDYSSLDNGQVFFSNDDCSITYLEEIEGYQLVVEIAYPYVKDAYIFLRLACFEKIGKSLQVGLVPIINAIDLPFTSRSDYKSSIEYWS